MGISLVKQKRGVVAALLPSGRFTRHGWRLDVYIDLLAPAAATDKLAAEEDRGGNDDQKDHYYCHYCGVAAATAGTIILSHETHPPLCIHDSLFAGDVIVLEHAFSSDFGDTKPLGEVRGALYVNGPCTSKDMYFRTETQPRAARDANFQ